MRKILVVDDDVDLVKMLSTFLKLKNIEAIPAYCSSQIPNKLDFVDLILLDINLPNEDGFEICRRIRENWAMPILFLTARSSEVDKVKGLMIGGDDYITKPFSLDELYARIYANINRMNRKQLSNTGITINQGICRINGQEVDLTKTEYDIVYLLSNYPKQVFSKERIYDHLWGLEAEGNSQVVSEHIRNIRNKFKTYTEQDFIRTHWGIGYSWIG